MSVEATHVASTNDAGMYSSCQVHGAIVDGRLPKWAHVVLDEAFGCTDQELVAWSQSKTHPLSQEKDAFNYFLSAQRQSVERVFGVLYNRFGILWRQMSFSFDRYKLILVCLCRFQRLIVFKIQKKLTVITGCTILFKKTHYLHV